MANIRKQLSLRQRKMWQALNPPVPKAETDGQRALRILREHAKRLAKNPIRGEL
jgi:hypothetical protein